MWERILEMLHDRGISVLLGLFLGAVIAWLIGWWRRLRERRSILRGDARDTVVIAHHIFERGQTPGKEPAYAMRIRSLGQDELKNVVPNGHLASELLHRAFQVTPRDTLISMEGAEGSYLLETLTNFVCDRVANAPFDHALYVMAPCCEPAALAQHQPITVLLIAVADLALFEDWAGCREIQVEHGADGARILTLLELAKRYKKEREELDRRRHLGQRTRHVETMYVLDLALDKRAAEIPVKKVPWGRFEAVLQEMNLE
ncbi:MAG: LapA family protein [Gemmataceae bacterium]